MAQPLTFAGILPANLLPFRPDYSIHEPDYRRHLKWLAGTHGVTGIVCNGHAAEVASLTREERRRTLAIAVDEVGGRLPLVAGVYADGSLEAAELARDAKAEGARGLLVFPPSLFMCGVQIHPEMAWAHHARIADAVDLPLVAFQYPVASGIGYTTETLVRLTEIPTVVAVKEWSNDIVAFERNLRAIRATGRPVAILSSFTMSLLSTFLLGADGAISGFGSVVADLQAELFAYARSGDVESARKLSDRLDPLVRAVYAPPFVDMHNRMKEMLVLLGRLDGPAVVRPPLVRVSDAERARLRTVLREADVVGTGSAR
jgi:4-hydroxy-tetrahydrodipicolinate synthase